MDFEVSDSKGFLKNNFASARGLANEQITKQEKRFWQTPAL